MDWEPPAEWIRVRTIDAHAGGEPLRIVTEGFPDLAGATMLERRRFACEHCDLLRKALMWEPRGHADMYGCIVTPPASADGDFGVLFLHNEGYSTMCGHGIIALVKVGLETGFLARPAGRDELRIDTPAGRVRAQLREDGAVSFLNVPSFVLEEDVELEVPGLGPVRCDLAFGGAFYAYVDARELGLGLRPADAGALIDAGRRIKAAVGASRRIAHPAGDADLGFLYGTIFVGHAEGEAHSRNVCVFADDEVDRSPTGTGVSGRAALLYARGELAPGESIRIESILGTTFEVAVRETVRVGGLDAVVPEVTGTAHVTGRHEFLLDPHDPLRGGFFLRG